ncbi:MAG: hypothetical protein ACJAT5_000046 [Lentimonas sp.]|jgi:hypothetical protein
MRLIELILIVEDQIILEFKAMDTLNIIYMAQFLTYQKFPSSLRISYEF